MRSILADIFVARSQFGKNLLIAQIAMDLFEYFLKGDATPHAEHSKSANRRPAALPALACASARPPRAVG